MEAASAAISPLGFAMDLMLHRVLTRMRKRSAARSGGASTLMAGLGGGTRTCWRARLLRLQESNGSGSDSDARKKKGEWGQPRPGPPYL
jgi:hypothetical protein